VTQPDDKNRTIKSELGYKLVIDAIYNNRKERIYKEKSPTIRASRQGQKNESGNKLNPRDYEILQTVPDNYTNHVSNTQRYKMLGNGWTVDVIAHIFKGLL
ncbi:MAG: DNA cytosine methyltransferase, partial [Candidatus Thorarchaeota archaeon]